MVGFVELFLTYIVRQIFGRGAPEAALLRSYMMPRPMLPASSCACKFPVTQAIQEGKDVWKELLGVFEGVQAPLVSQEQLDALMNQKGSSTRQQLRDAAIHRLLVKLQVCTMKLRATEWMRHGL
jgi:hypothetical protein